jgi:hypothetical protein
MEIPASLSERIEEARKRLQSHRRWQAWLAWSLPVCGVCLALALVSRIVYFPYSAAVVAACAGCGLTVSAVLAARVSVSSLSAAARLDLAEGLRERLSTVTECAGEDSSGEVMEALLADAQAAAKNCTPRRSLVFQAPRTLPVTLGLAIAVIALMIAPRAFGRSERSLPAIERIALSESIRLNATLKLLDDRNLPGGIANPMKKLKEDLEGGDIHSARQTLVALQSRIEHETGRAEERNAVLDSMRESEALEKLGELLSVKAPPGDIAKEAAAGLNEDPSRVEEALREVLNRLEKDSELRGEVEDALKAARKKDAEAFVKAMEKLGRKMANMPGAKDLKIAGARIKSLNEKLSRAGEPHPPDAGEREGDTAPPGEMPPVPEIAAQTALEEAIEREKVPERFRNLVRMYFARSEENAGR